jgi:hypothetical protein
MKKLFFSTLLSLTSLFFAASLQAATIRIDTTKIELELEPGQVYTGEIVAENPSEDETRARIYLEDWVYAKGGTGEKIFSPVGSTPRSASKWITFTPADAVLKPFARIISRYTISVPKDAKDGAFYSVLFFETILGSEQDEEGVNILVAGRIGALFIIQIKGTAVRSGKIDEVQITPPTGNKPLRIETTFTNSGNIDITLGGTFLIMDPAGIVKGRGELNSIYTFPGATEKGTTEWVGRLPKGSYQILLTYDLGKGKSLVEEKTLVIE